MKRFINLLLLSALSGAVICFLVGCSRSSFKVGKQNDANNLAASTDQDFDACSLVSNDEIAGVQGETVVNVRKSSRVVNSLLVSQCFYELKTYSKSVSFEITQTAPNASEEVDLEKMWEEKFNKEIPADNDRQEEEENEGKEDKEKPAKTLGEPKAGGQPQAVPNVGEAAFRVGNRITNALYVLQDNRIIRVSVGGAEDQDAKLEKLKQIAQNALKRL